VTEQAVAEIEDVALVALDKAIEGGDIAVFRE
jgi:hypothetical protein